VLSLASHNAFQSDLALNSFTLTLRGQVGNTVPSVPDSSNAALLLGFVFLGVIAARHLPRPTRATHA
jgi:hypothetical protein